MGANYQLGVAEKLVMKESPHKALSLILIALNQLQVRGAAGEVAALPRGGDQRNSGTWRKFPASQPDHDRNDYTVSDYCSFLNSE